MTKSLVQGVKGRKISIVFEETGGEGFNVYISGYDRDLNGVPYEKMSPGEFWASRMFSFVIDIMKEAGVVKSYTPVGKGGGTIQ